MFQIKENTYSDINPLFFILHFGGWCKGVQIFAFEGVGPHCYTCLRSEANHLLFSLAGLLSSLSCCTAAYWPDGQLVAGKP